MSVGHGRPGSLSGLRTFSRLMDSLVQGSRQRTKPYIEYQLCLPMPGSPAAWVVHSGSIYRYRAAPAGEEAAVYGLATLYDELLRDVVEIETAVLPRPLVRVESIATVVAGTYFADIDNPVTGVDFVQRVEIYLHLPDSSDPNNTQVIFRLLWCVGAYGEVHPWLGPNRLTNGNLDTWISSTNITSWDETLTTGITLAQVAAISGRGTYAAQFTLASGGTGTSARINQSGTVDVVAGTMIRLSGVYSTDEKGLPPGVNAVLRFLRGDTAVEVMPDGRTSIGTGSGFVNATVLTQTYGAVRRFIWDVLVPSGYTNAVLWLALSNTGGAAPYACTITFDDVKWQRIWRWNVYEPKLRIDGTPIQEIMSQSIMFGQKSISLGSMAIDNSDGSMAQVFDQLISINQPAQVLVGGTFPDGEEIYRDEWHEAFRVRMRGAEVGDNAVTIQLEDSRGLTKILTPPNRYSAAEETDLDENREGDVKPHYFGYGGIYDIKPTRVGIYASGYGIYEFADPEVPILTGTLLSAGAIRSYPNEELADKDEKGLDVISVAEWSPTTFDTQWVITKDVQNYQYDKGGNDVGTDSIFDFNIGGAEMHADLNIAGSAPTVCTALAARMNAVAGVANITVVHNDITKKFTVARGSGTLQLLPQTGLNKQKQSWKLLGFDTGVNRTGALTYTGDEATYVSPEANHVLRFFAFNGYDNTEYHPDVAKWLLQYVAKVPLSRINVESFEAATQLAITDGQDVRMVIDQQRGLDTLLAELDLAGMMDTVVDGAGVWHCIKQETVIRRYFDDSDYLEDSFRMWHDPNQIFKHVRVLYNWHASKQKFLGSTVEVGGGVKANLDVKFGTDEVPEVKSWLTDNLVGAQLLADRLSNFSRNRDDRTPRLVRFDAAGKLLDLLPGYLISLTRSRGLDSSGTGLDGVTFRILGLRYDYGTGRATCTAVENIDYLTP